MISKQAFSAASQRRAGLEDLRLLSCVPKLKKELFSAGFDRLSRILHATACNV
jgi:hypothetical protein